MKMAQLISPKVLMGLFIVAALIAIPLEPLQAQGGAELICEPSKGTYGLQIFIKGNGFAPNSQIQIEAFGQTIAPQSDNTGQFMVIAYAPTDPSKFKPGEYTLTAKDAAGDSAETVFTLEELQTVVRPPSPAAPGSPAPQLTPPSGSATQPPSPAMPTAVEAVTTPVKTPEGEGISSVVIIVIAAGAFGLILLAVAIFFTLARRRETYRAPIEQTAPTRPPRARVSGPAVQTPKRPASTTGEKTTEEEPLKEGETTLVMPTVPKLSTRPTLQIMEGEGEGTVFSLDQKTTVIGRGEDCDIIINHPMVSRHHAKVVRVGPSFYIHDLQSTNGTMVNGENIDQHVLQPEDEIQIGVTLLLFQQPKAE